MITSNLQAARAVKARSYVDINDWWRGDGICANRWSSSVIIGHHLSSSVIRMTKTMKMRIKKILTEMTLKRKTSVSEVGVRAAFQNLRMMTPATSHKNESYYDNEHQQPQKNMDPILDNLAIKPGLLDRFGNTNQKHKSSGKIFEKIFLWIRATKIQS